MYSEKLGKIMKGYENPKPFTPTTGKVIKESPLQISVFEGKVIIYPDMMIKTKGLSLQVGDKVLVIPDRFGNKWYIISEVE
jgi:hypothetical protein